MSYLTPDQQYRRSIEARHQEWLTKIAQAKQDQRASEQAKLDEHHRTMFHIKDLSKFLGADPTSVGLALDAVGEDCPLKQKLLTELDFRIQAAVKQHEGVDYAFPELIQEQARAQAEAEMFKQLSAGTLRFTYGVPDSPEPQTTKVRELDPNMKSEEFYPQAMRELEDIRAQIDPEVQRKRRAEEYDQRRQALVNNLSVQLAEILKTHLGGN